MRVSGVVDKNGSALMGKKILYSIIAITRLKIMCARLQDVSITIAKKSLF